MLKKQCLQILKSLNQSEEVNISMEEYQYFMFYLRNRTITLDFISDVTGDRVKILKKEDKK